MSDRDSVELLVVVGDVRRTSVRGLNIHFTLLMLLSEAKGEGE
jgi:hypothetical protein